VDFKNTVVIMTSNVGAQFIRSQMSMGFAAKKEGKGQKLDYDTMKERVLAEMKKTFRPEFINRIDEIIVFHQLNEEQLRQVVELLVKELQERLADRKLNIELTDKAKAWLVKEGYDPVYGARPLRRAIERYVENPLSSKLLAGEFKEGDTVKVDQGDKGLAFTLKKKAKAAA
jgi:ATP-dependent Clp protease ATP-binding subunit ClpC